MHIPDGYLSPQTAVPVFIGMVPVWAVAFNKVKKFMSSKRVPLLSLCAAFSFIIMMFNVPVLGGSSAHAVGAVFIAILLGPWAACIAVSSALIIQAFVFGDGGIIALGVNCLNMAVIMPFTGYYIFRAIKGRTELSSKRGLAGACIGSYLGLNIAAFFAALEFGIQPLLFKAADGTPLYCPYGLGTSISSMMLAHGVFAGPIEAIITTAGVAYLAKFAPYMFAGRLPAKAAAEPAANFFIRYRAMLIPFAALIVLTPLGLLARGTAWGEWGGSEIKQAIGYLPSGFARFSDWWSALMPRYSLPAFGRGAFASSAGYLISAIVGIILICSLSLLTSRLMLIFKKKQG
jgi:cobalt/nickel transport system permease protein